ncbi:MAG: hypothetical protein ACR2NO_05645 [Chloroflexota bacterium]
MASTKWGIEVQGLNRIKRAFKVLGETDAPFLREALGKGGQMLRVGVASRAPGSMAARTGFVGVQGTGTALRATIKVKHPGAARMEFGRKPKPYKKGRPRPGYRYRGQRARPFIGIKAGDATIGAVKPDITRMLTAAWQSEWQRLASGSDAP